MPELEGQTGPDAIVVTGAGSGIGRACAVRFGARGYVPLLVGRTAASLVETAEIIRTAGGDAHVYVCDVSSEVAVAALQVEIAAAWRSVRGLVNSAGTNYRAAITEFPADRWGDIIGVQLTGVFLTTRAFVPLLARHGSGAAIVNISSIFGLIGVANISAYSAAKGGVSALTRQLAVELAPLGIRVNAVSPGPIGTAQLLTRYASAPEQLAAIAADVPLKRLGTPAEVAAVVEFLASEDASYVTGADVTVDGGRTIR